MKLPARDKILILLIYSLVLAGILIIYHTRRIAAVQKFETVLKNTRGEITAIKNLLSTTEARNNRLVARVDILSYIESLYRAADDNQLKFHEVTSDVTQSASAARDARDAAFSSTRLTITVKGNFRSIAEYVRTILNLQQLSRVSAMKITADGDTVVGSIHIELFTLH